MKEYKNLLQRVKSKNLLKLAVIAARERATFGEISTKISRMWDCLSSKEKNSYRPKREKVMPHLGKLDSQNLIQINSIANSLNIKVKI